MIATRNVLLALATAAAVAACRSSTEVTTNYTASLSGQNERPPVQSNGSGTFTATLSANNRLDYTMTFTGLGTAVTMAHIHGPANAQSNAGILVDFEAPPVGSSGTIQLGSTAGTASGSLNLGAAISATVSGDSLRKLLDAGLLYVNVHTTAHPAGEIRGQIVRQ
jgi:hypothetical protein